MATNNSWDNDLNPWRNLANGIVIQAMDDWADLLKLIVNGVTDVNGRYCNPRYEHKRSYSFRSLRNFFKSDWCALLCGKLNPSILLKELERRRKAVIDEMCERA